MVFGKCRCHCDNFDLTLLWITEDILRLKVAMRKIIFMKRFKSLCYLKQCIFAKIIVERLPLRQGIYLVGQWNLSLRVL